MLAGEPPFTGPTTQAIVARVLTASPAPLTQTRSTVPASVEQAVLTALAKLPADRFATPKAFAAALAARTNDQASSAPTIASRAAAPRSARVPVLLGVCLVAACVLAAWGWLRPTPAAATTRVALALRASQAIEPGYWGFSLDLSPDGRRLAYVGPGTSRGSSQVWVRPLDGLDAAPVAGTTGAIGVQWSPDARELLVMVSRQQASVVSVDGSKSVALRDVSDASYGADGRIYFDNKDSRILRESVGGVADTLYRGDTSFILILRAGSRGVSLALAGITPSCFCRA
jgi:serine/threonine-protein kinase